MAYNRGKKSVALDFTKPEGQAIVHKLLAGADVMVENFRPGVLKKYGLDYASVAAKYPKLIYLSISAYGQTGPLSDRPGYDPVLQAESGMMGGSESIDYLAPSGSGENTLVTCDNGDYAADLEIATGIPRRPELPPRLDAPEEIETPGATTIEALAEQLG